MRKTHGTMATIRQQERNQLSLPQRHNEKDTRNNGDYTTARKKKNSLFLLQRHNEKVTRNNGDYTTGRKKPALSSAKTQRERHTEKWRLYDSKKEKNTLFLLQRHNEEDTGNNGDYTTARKKPALSFFCKDTMRKSHGTMATIRQQERSQLSLPQRHNEKDTRNNGDYTTARKKKNSLFLLQRHNEKVTRNNGDYTTGRKKPALSSAKTQRERHTEKWRLYDSKKEKNTLFLLQRHNEEDTGNNGDYTTARKKPALSFFCKDTMRKSHGTMATIRQQERNQLSLSSAKTQRGRHTEQWRLYDSYKETSSLFLLQRHNEKDTRNNGDYTTARKKPALSFFCKDTMRKSHGTMATIRQQERNQLSLSSAKTQ